MGYAFQIHRISNRTKDYDARHLEAVRAAIAQSKDLLKDSGASSTFAGHKTQEPFPEEKESKQ